MSILKKLFGSSGNQKEKEGMKQKREAVTRKYKVPTCGCFERILKGYEVMKNSPLLEQYGFVSSHCLSCGQSYWTFLEKTKAKRDDDYFYKNTHTMKCSENELAAIVSELRQNVIKETNAIEDEVYIMMDILSKNPDGGFSTKQSML